jgi:hypothetical protein
MPLFYRMNKKYFVSTCFLIISLCGYFTTISLSFLVIQEVDARCPNGYHKSPSGNCEKVTDTKGMPRCPNGYHRSPDGDCERVSSSATADTDNGKSSRENDDDDDDNSKNNGNKYFNFTNRKNNNENNSDDKSNDPLNQIFGNNNNAKDNDEKEEESEPTLPKPTLSDEIELAGKVNHVVDGDTLDINDIRIRLSLVDTPEKGDPGFKEATQFVVKLCLGENAEVDMDDG